MAFTVTAQEILDEFTTLASTRSAWEKYWRDCTKFALPNTDAFDTLFSTGWAAASTSMISQPTASRKTIDLYDQTSLWAIERLTAGLVSLKTPESGMWHNLGIDDPFGYEPDHAEKTWMEKTRNYLFSVRANPQSGFWPAHKSTVRSVCAYGDGFMYIEEQFGRQSPWRYELCPLAECYTGVDAAGVTNRMFRLMKMSAAQMVGKWGADAVSEKVRVAADDPKKRHDTFLVLHAVLPRKDLDRAKVGARGGAFASFYVEVDLKHVIGEGGYFEFPFIRQAWSRIGARPYCEGPMALALAEVKSLNELAMNELISAQQAVRPPLATIGENFTRINLNAGAVNPGLVNGDGKLLVQPVMTQARPDFAQAVLQARRDSVREMLYLNLWQVLIQEGGTQTATEALLRAQEKGELLGPVGISFNEGLSHMVDREMGTLARKGAFDADAPMAAPKSVMKRNISPRFTAPLDRLRKSEEVIGAQRVVESMVAIAGVDPQSNIMARLDTDAYVVILQEGLGAPYSMLKPPEETKQADDAQGQVTQTAATLALMQQGGAAAQAIGAGGTAMAEGSQAVQNSGPMSSVLNGLASMQQAA